MSHCWIEGQKRINEAKKIQRDLGLTFFRERKDVVTGELEAEVVADIGMPGGSSGWNVFSTAALMGTGAWLITQSSHQYTKSETATAVERDARKRRMLGYGLAGVACFVAIFPSEVNVSRYMSGSESTVSPMINRA